MDNKKHGKHSSSEEKKDLKTLTAQEQLEAEKQKDLSAGLSSDANLDTNAPETLEDKKDEGQDKLGDGGGSKEDFKLDLTGTELNVQSEAPDPDPTEESYLTEEENTYGKRLVRTAFNPSKNGAVHSIKMQHARLIDHVYYSRRYPTGTENWENLNRWKNKVIDSLETSCMYSVKIITV